MTLVVSDASPLIALYQLDELKILHGLFGEVVIPPAVAKEIAPRTVPAWLITRPLATRTPLPHSVLGPGESEAIALASQDGAHLLLLDDRAARRIAQALGLAVAGTLSVLLRAKEKGLLQQLRPHVEALLHGGFYAAPSLVKRILSEAGEG